jgi:hypothetical protein
VDDARSTDQQREQARDRDDPLKQPPLAHLCRSRMSRRT